MSLPILTMAANVQKIETRQTQSGKSVTTISLSCGEKNSKNEYENLYIKADFWDKQSDFVSKYFHEGSAILVTGKLVTTNYTKQDGSKVYETKFLFPQASFLPKDKDAQLTTNAQPTQNAPQPQNQQATIPTIDIANDDIPFAPIDRRL